MVNLKGLKIPVEVARKKAKALKLVITDVDGVLTDTGVFYSAEGELMKRFSIRDGMGVERLRNECNLETGIMTGENSSAVLKRAEKLKITRYFPGIKDKKAAIMEFIDDYDFSLEEIAFIGDDYNDVEILGIAGLTACPADAMPYIKTLVDYVSDVPAGYGAFRDFAELIIFLRNDLR
jgi:YrbI family 3-deoxy-D-manno-octulosonate 8-phosphate phosphatase